MIGTGLGEKGQQRKSTAVGLHDLKPTLRLNLETPHHRFELIGQFGQFGCAEVNLTA